MTTEHDDIIAQILATRWRAQLDTTDADEATIVHHWTTPTPADIRHDRGPVV